MCHTAILPTTLKSDQTDNIILRVTYLFNRWLKMLKSYNGLDPTTINEDFALISKVVKSEEVKSNIKKAVTKCRDLALAGDDRQDELSTALQRALKMLCREQDDNCIRRIKKNYADQGMTERYRPLSKRLEKETIHRIGRSVSYTNSKTDSPEVTKLVRRFVEKRAAQAVFKNSGKTVRQTNRFRQSVRRATSFSLYNATFTDYDIRKRAPGTHWRVLTIPSKGKKRLKSKHCYNTFEEAVIAAKSYTEKHPEDIYPMVPYLCEHCGKWHIGHDRNSSPTPIQSAQEVSEAC